MLAHCPSHSVHQGYGDGDGLPNPHAFGSKEGPKRSTAPVTIYSNCTVYVGDAAAPPAEAFAVQGGRFVAVGSAAAVAAAAEGLPVTAVDLGGAYVTPGLIDAHLHLIPGGLDLAQRASAALRRADSRAAFVAAVADAVAAATPGEWILGGGWDESRWGGAAPAADWIDGVSPANPVFLTRLDAHQGLANSLALAAAGITAASPDPPGGVIARGPGPGAAPTGLLSDAAMSAVAAAIPPPTVAQRRAALEAAQAHLLAVGITSVHDMGRIAFLDGEDAAWEDLEEVYLPAANAGTLKIRVQAFVALSTWRRAAERARHVGRVHPGGRLSWGGVKEFYDGSLGSRTALMHEAYADGPVGGAGTRTVDPAAFAAAAAAADAAGLQLAVHAIGDAAVDDVLAVYAAIERQARKTGQRTAKQQSQRGPHRIEHAQHISGPAAVAQMAALGVAVTPNPLHLVADAGILEPRLGAARVAAGAYAFRALCGGGGAAACGFASDWPVVPVDPVGTLRAAAAGGRAQSVAPAAALAAQTAGAAAVGGQEREVGAIAPGLRADFVVFDGDVLDTDAAPAAVVSTWIDGRCEHGCGSGGKPPGNGSGDREEL